VFALARECLGRSELPKSEGPFYMNVFRMFFALSWTVGPAIASWMMVLFSYEGLFLAAGGCFALLFGAVWLWVPSQPPIVQAGTTAHASLGRVLKRFDVLAHFLGFVLIFASGTIGMMNLPLMVKASLAGNERHIGIIYSIAPVFELPLMLYFGALATKKDPARIIRLGILIAVAYYALLALVRAPWHVYPLQFLSAAVVAVTSGVAITYFQNYLPHHAGTATNLYATAQRIGSTVGYLLFGTLSWKFGYRNVFLWCTLFSAVSLALMYIPGKPDVPD
jgi:MFS transporter, SET family, sugar efflux transporter